MAIIYSNLHGGDNILIYQDNDTSRIIFGKFGKLSPPCVTWEGEPQIITRQRLYLSATDR